MKAFLRDSWPLALLVLTIVFMLWQFPHKAVLFAPKAQEEAPQKPFASFVTLSGGQYAELLRQAGLSRKARTGIRVSSAMASDAGPALSDPPPPKEYMPLPEKFHLAANLVKPEFPEIENRLLPESLAAPEIEPLPVPEKKQDALSREMADALKAVPETLEKNFNKRKGENNDDRTRGIERFYGD